MKSRILACAALFATLGLPLAASAGTAQATVSVTATVVPDCTIEANPLAFGNYDPLVANNSNDLPGQTTLTVTCTQGSTPSTTISGADQNGNGSGTMFLSGQTTGGLNFTYQLVPPASITTGLSAPNVYTLNGLVAAGQDVAVGSYSTTLVATVNF